MTFDETWARFQELFGRVGRDVQWEFLTDWNRDMEAWLRSTGDEPVDIENLRHLTGWLD